MYQSFMVKNNPHRFYPSTIVNEIKKRKRREVNLTLRVYNLSFMLILFFQTFLHKTDSIMLINDVYAYN